MPGQIASNEALNPDDADQRTIERAIHKFKELVAGGTVKPGAPKGRKQARRD